MARPHAHMQDNHRAASRLLATEAIPSPSPLRFGCMDSPRRLAPSRRLGGTYFPVLFWAACTGSSSGKQQQSHMPPQPSSCRLPVILWRPKGHTQDATTLQSLC